MREWQQWTSQQDRVGDQWYGQPGNDAVKITETDEYYRGFGRHYGEPIPQEPATDEQLASMEAAWKTIIRLAKQEILKMEHEADVLTQARCIVITEDVVRQAIARCSMQGGWPCSSV